VKSRRSDSQWCRLKNDPGRSERCTRRHSPELRVIYGERRWKLHGDRRRLRKSRIRRSRRESVSLVVAKASSPASHRGSVIRRALLVAVRRGRSLGRMMLVVHACEIADHAGDRRPNQCHKQEGCGTPHTHQSTTLRHRTRSAESGPVQMPPQPDAPGAPTVAATLPLGRGLE
jgi:hypothetical protein